MAVDQQPKPAGQRPTPAADRTDRGGKRQVEAELMAMLDAVLDGEPSPVEPARPATRVASAATSAKTDARRKPSAVAGESAIISTPRSDPPLHPTPAPTAKPGEPRAMWWRRAVLVLLGIIAALLSAWATIYVASKLTGRSPLTGILFPTHRRTADVSLPALREAPAEALGQRATPALPTGAVRPVRPGLTTSPRAGPSEERPMDAMILGRPLPPAMAGPPGASAPATTGGIAGSELAPRETVLAPEPRKETESPTTGGDAAAALTHEEAAIRETLHQYQNAYDQLNARAAASVWPSVDERALARAFAALASHDLVFDRCDVTVGLSTATAWCRGSAKYVTKVGRSIEHVEPRQWTFNLKKIAAEWKIDTVEGSR